jgi:TrmH family RNA methyltransferase
MNKNTVKFIKSLHLKKYRKEEVLFLVEGEKSIIELLKSDFQIKNIFITREIFEKYRNEFQKFDSICEIVSADDLTKASTLEFNDTGIAIVLQKENSELEINGDIVVALDDIRDPGNFGTIVRTADWYGVKKIVCSVTTAEFYNPKVIASSMGSFTRVQIFYTDLEKYLENNKSKNIPILGTLLDGSDAHTFSYPDSGILLMGNESNGIHETLMPFITNKITIPRYGSAESLNVSMATGIILDNWKRK